MSNFATFSKLGSFGHLGNQMFQISFVYSYCKKNNKQLVFTLDKNNTMSFKCFNFYNKFNMVQHINATKTYREKKFNYDQSVFDSEYDDFIGYFQSEKYFLNFSDELRQIFNFKEKSEQFTDYCFIHVRRGDYLLYPNIHPICSDEYYSKSIEEMKNKIGNNLKFLIFSDDIKECKKYKCFNDSNMMFYESNNPYHCLFSMSTCSHAIIANSSFSWWGSWLINNPHKYIIAPKLWFGSDGPKDSEDICPIEWKKI